MGVGVNTTDPLAQSVHGTNPQNLLEKITRLKIYANLYWKEFCFGITAEHLVDRAMDLKYFGGTFGGNSKPSNFLCLVLKMLQLQPEKEIVIEFIKNEDFKYVRVLGAFYLRLVGKPVDIYKYLELLYNDFRKIRHRTHQGWELVRVDEFIDELLTKDYACDIALPHLPKRWSLEELSMLPPRKSLAVEDLDDESDDEATLQTPNQADKQTTDRQGGGAQVEGQDSRSARHSKRRAADNLDERHERDHHESRVRASSPRSRETRKDAHSHRDRDRPRKRSTSREQGQGRKRDPASRDRRGRRRSMSSSSSSSSSSSPSPQRRADRGGYKSRRSPEGRSKRSGYKGSNRRHRSYSRSYDRSYGRSKRRRSRSPRSRSKDRRSSSGSDSSVERYRRAEKRKERASRGEKKSKQPNKEKGGQDKSKESGGKEGSVEFWNDQRAKLGLKPLK